MFLSYGTIFPSGSVALTSNVWQKNFQVNWSYQKVSTYMVARFRT